jgi:UPF0755 protein
MSKKKKDIGYAVAILGAKGVIRILLYVLVAIFFISVARMSYVFGYSIFNEQAMASEPGQDVIVEIPEGASSRDIADILKKNDLIESKWIFVAQEMFSSYHGDLQSGTFLLNTSEKPTEMMRILAGIDTEGQPGASAES